MRHFALAAALLFAAVVPSLSQTPPGPPPGPRPPAMEFIDLPFPDGGVIPNQYTAAAEKQPAGSFPLAWKNVPAGTQSFVLVFHDLDVAAGRSMTDNLHWLAFNIPGNATSLPASMPTATKLPDGTIQPMNRNRSGYAGPGAPPGKYHHYVVQLYALDTKLSLTETATRDEVAKASEGHVLGKAVLVGRFHR